MAISLKHAFQSAKADGADASLVRPSNWNAEHTLTLAASRLLGRATASAGAAEEISLGSGLSFSGTQLKFTNNADVAATASTTVVRDPSGDIYARLIRQEYAVTSGSCAYFIGQVAVGGGSADNFLRPMTIAQAAAALDSALVPVARQVIAGNGLTGGGALSADRTVTLGTPSNITNSSTNSVTATSHAHALGFVAAEVYTGTNVNEVNYPLGHTVMIQGDYAARNASVDIRLHPSFDYAYSIGGTGLDCAGTWRMRGTGSSQISMAERTA